MQCVHARQLAGGMPRAIAQKIGTFLLPADGQIGTAPSALLGCGEVTPCVTIRVTMCDHV